MGAVIRPMGAEDRAFVLAAWLRSYGDSESALIATPRDAGHLVTCEACGVSRVAIANGRPKAGREYWHGQSQLVEALLRRATTLVAESVVDGVEMLDGFASYELSPRIVHFVYVRRSARGRGLARQLVAELDGPGIVTYSHRTRTLSRARLPAHWRYSPYATMEGFQP
ncbi:MAG TPA: GNAT family N-acetyltransferase [Polyangiaceae bacterium]|nr:GNAT family N-acetyltransferase [Polyangiaceae bacterium]